MQGDGEMRNVKLEQLQAEARRVAGNNLLAVGHPTDASQDITLLGSVFYLPDQTWEPLMTGKPDFLLTKLAALPDGIAAGENYYVFDGFSNPVRTSRNRAMTWFFEFLGV